MLHSAQCATQGARGASPHPSASSLSLSVGTSWVGVPPPPPYWHWGDRAAAAPHAVPGRPLRPDQCPARGRGPGPREARPVLYPGAAASGRCVPLLGPEIPCL